MSAHSKLSSLYLHAGSFVPRHPVLEDPHLTHSAGALSEHNDPASHLDRLRRERRATAPAGKPRRQSKLDEAIERADASFVRLSVTDLVCSPYSAPFTLGGVRDTHEARRAGRASFASNLSAAATTTSPNTPRTPLTSTRTPIKTFAHAAPYLHDDAAGVLPHFHHAAGERHELHMPRPTHHVWARSAQQKHQPKSVPADHTRVTMRDAAKASTRATTEKLADLKLRDECIAAMRRAEASRPVRPTSKKTSRLVSLLEAAKNKTTSRILTIKRALHTRGGFR